MRKKDLGKENQETRMQDIPADTKWRAPSSRGVALVQRLRPRATHFFTALRDARGGQGGDGKRSLSTFLM
jgi:hypothetical protein